VESDVPNYPNKDIENIAATANGLHASATELHAGLTELRALLGSGELPTTLDDVDATAQRAVDHTAARLEAVIDHATVRAIQLVVAVLACVVVYRAGRAFVGSRRRGTAAR
jgi:hypothetical protein